ncbi:nuclear transport factor 2 family protein [Gulosibacter chungangensis]|nr:nuclear transport factor 2 family protein [Gulosibacter chungangensis]
MTAITAQETDLLEEAKIRRLNYEYANAIDNSRVEDVVNSFTEDGVFDMQSLGAPAAFEGAEGLRAAFTGMVESMAGCLHMMMNHLIEVAGDRATGTVYCDAYTLQPDGERVQMLVFYTDQYVKQDGEWKFAERIVKPLLAGAKN